MPTSRIIRPGKIKGAHFVAFGLSLLCAMLTVNAQVAPTPASVQAAAHRAARYLVKSVKADGTFLYRLNMDPTRAVKRKYNILRHAGTIYAMGMYHQRYPDATMLSAMVRTGKYLRDQAVRPVPDRDGLLAVWSDPKVNNSNSPLQAKLGGTGLGLVALLSLERTHPGFTPLDDLQALGRFIVFMQTEEGDFCSKYVPSTGGCSDKWRSLFYPGEAILGLLMLYEHDPSRVWFDSAAKGMAYLANTRKDSDEVPVDHWALLATAKLFSVEKETDLPVSSELLINHAVQICEVILESQVNNPKRPAYDGGFSKKGKTTPTATRLEGLQAALSFLPADREIRQRIESAVSRGVAFLLRAQVREGHYLGALPRAVDYMHEAATDAHSFNRRVKEVRIDYVQHALSAMIQYLEWRDGES